MDQIKADLATSVLDAANMPSVIDKLWKGCYKNDALLCSGAEEQEK